MPSSVSCFRKKSFGVFGYPFCHWRRQVNATLLCATGQSQHQKFHLFMHRLLCRPDSNSMAQRPSLLKPLLFCTAASGAAFLGAAAYAQRRDRVTSKLRRVKNSLQQDFNTILNSKQEPPDTIWGQAREAWESAGFNTKAVYAIIGANIALYTLGFPDLQVTEHSVLAPQNNLYASSDDDHDVQTPTTAKSMARTLSSDSTSYDLPPLPSQYCMHREFRQACCSHCGACHLQGALSKWCTMPLPPKAMQPVITATGTLFN